MGEGILDPERSGILWRRRDPARAVACGRRKATAGPTHQREKREGKGIGRPRERGFGRGAGGAGRFGLLVGRGAGRLAASWAWSAWLARGVFFNNRQTKVKRTKIIKTIYRHNIYKNVQKNIS